MLQLNFILAIMTRGGLLSLQPLSRQGVTCQYKKAIWHRKGARAVSWPHFSNVEGYAFASFG